MAALKIADEVGVDQAVGHGAVELQTRLVEHLPEHGDGLLADGGADELKTGGLTLLVLLHVGNGVVIEEQILVLLNKVVELIGQVDPQLLGGHIGHDEAADDGALRRQHQRHMALGDAVLFHRVPQLLRHGVPGDDAVILDEILQQRQGHQLLHAALVGHRELDRAVTDVQPQQ